MSPSNWPANLAMALYTVACKAEWDAGQAPAQKQEPKAKGKITLNKAEIDRALFGRTFRSKRNKR